METKYKRLWTLFGMVWVGHTVASDHEDAISPSMFKAVLLDMMPGQVRSIRHLFGRSNLSDLIGRYLKPNHSRKMVEIQTNLIEQQGSLIVPTQT